MPAAVKIDDGGGQPISNGNALSPIRYIIEALAPGQDPLTVSGIPPERSALVKFGRTYSCDDVGVSEWVSPTSCIVEARFSNDSRWRRADPPLPEDMRNFERTYKKVDVAAFAFLKGREKETRPDGSEIEFDWWHRNDFTIPTEWQVLGITVKLDLYTDAAILQAMAAADAQANHIHIFPAFPNKLWLMKPCAIERLATSIRISYVWEHDPGNGPVAYPSDSVLDVKSPMARGSFQVYQPRPAIKGRVGYETPGILLADLFPTTNNPFYTPNGWQGLPGSPI